MLESKVPLLSELIGQLHERLLVAQREAQDSGLTFVLVEPQGEDEEADGSTSRLLDGDAAGSGDGKVATPEDVNPNRLPASSIDGASETMERSVPSANGLPSERTEVGVRAADAPKVCQLCASQASATWFLFRDDWVCGACFRARWLGEENLETEAQATVTEPTAPPGDPVHRAPEPVDADRAELRECPICDELVADAFRKYRGFDMCQKCYRALSDIG